MSATTEAARLFQALRNCSPEATKAYDLIVKLNKHPDFVVVMSAIYHAMHEAPADYSVPLSHLQEADEKLDDVYPVTSEQRAVWVAEDLAEQRRAA